MEVNVEFKWSRLNLDHSFIKIFMNGKKFILPIASEFRTEFLVFSTLSIPVLLCDIEYTVTYDLDSNSGQIVMGEKEKAHFIKNLRYNDFNPASRNMPKFYNMPSKPLSIFSIYEYESDVAFSMDLKDAPYVQCHILEVCKSKENKGVLFKLRDGEANTYLVRRVSEDVAQIVNL